VQDAQSKVVNRVQTNGTLCPGARKCHDAHLHASTVRGPAAANTPQPLRVKQSPAYLCGLVRTALRALGTVVGAALPVAAWNQVRTEHPRTVVLVCARSSALEVVNTAGLMLHTHHKKEALPTPQQRRVTAAWRHAANNTE
jgi:hypothetical protein